MGHTNVILVSVALRWPIKMIQKHKLTRLTRV